LSRTERVALAVLRDQHSKDEIKVQLQRAKVKSRIEVPLIWLQKYTKTKDPHWKADGETSEHRPFPDKPYFPYALKEIQREPVIFIEKSRDLMMSWLCVGYLMHACMTTPGIEVLFQSQTEDKAAELVDYAKTLYDQQDADIKAAYPLVKPSSQQGWLELNFANGSRIIGIPHGEDKVRSYHPWAILLDEAAFVEDAGGSYAAAISACKKIIVLSSAGPGWFADVVQSAEDDHKQLCRGVDTRRMADGTLVLRIYYWADPDRDPAIGKLFVDPRDGKLKTWKVIERAKYKSQQEWDREQEIIHEAGGGERLFAEVLTKYGDKIIVEAESGFEVPPTWRKVGGYDHGSTNPSGGLVGAVDHEGGLWLTGEYYMPGLSARQHALNLKLLEGFEQADVMADPSMFYKTQQQEDGSFRALAELYAEAGITNLQSAPDNTEITGMERILAHWFDLDNFEPMIRIVCPRALKDIVRPVYGLHNNGCPNLLWELRRARRAELSEKQLLTKNPTEKIVDKDNHLRDPLKYIVLSLPEPTMKTREQRVQEMLAHIPKEDATSRMIWIGEKMAELEEKEKPLVMGRRGAILRRRGKV